jgi:hypothetical protein
MWNQNDKEIQGYSRSGELMSQIVQMFQNSVSNIEKE